MGKRPLREKALVMSLQKKLLPKSQRHHGHLRALANILGVSGQAISNWETRNNLVSGPQVAQMLMKARNRALSNFDGSLLRPIVEFLQLDPVYRTKSGRPSKRIKLFDVRHPYYQGVQGELSNRHGIYVFYDTRGRALYVGKAAKLSLWDEMTNAFNRGRGDVQSIKKVRHPTRRVQYRSAEEKRRRIRPTQVQLHELARYVSAYEMPDSLIEVFEAILVRSFPNDLLNVRMEEFGKQRRKGAKPRRRS